MIDRCSESDGTLGIMPCVGDCCHCWNACTSEFLHKKRRQSLGLMGLSRAVGRERLWIVAVVSLGIYSPVVGTALNLGSNLQNQLVDALRIAQNLRLIPCRRQARKLDTEAGSHLRQSLVERGEKIRSLLFSCRSRLKQCSFDDIFIAWCLLIVVANQLQQNV